ncbi:hypothetical protein IAD21_03112 [Abditibacteriota bacterium]|nr:hypothetical protein IAD21_03112 [Abditibacteriota bacterium]
MSQQLQLAHPPQLDMNKLPPLTILLQKEGATWIATCRELGLEGQGETELEAKEALHEAVNAFLEQSSEAELEQRLADGYTPQLEILKISIDSRSKKFKKRIGQLVTGAIETSKTAGGAMVRSGSALIHKADDARGTIGNVAGRALGKAVDTGSNVAHHAYPLLVGFTGIAGVAVETLTDNAALRRLAKKFNLEKWLDVSERVDLEKAQKHVRKLKQRHPNETPRQIARRIAMEKAIYAGGFGAVTHLVPGSAISLLAIDVAATSLIQAELVYQIAAAYDLDLTDPARKGELLAVFACVLGTSRAVKAGLTVLKNVPIAGAVVGASSNTAMIYALGNVASRFYEEKLHLNVSQDRIDLVKNENEKFLQDASNQEALVDQILVHVFIAGQPNATHGEIIEAINKANLSPASMQELSTYLPNPQDLDALLDQITPDFAVYLLERCHHIAYFDGVATENEKEILEKIAKHFEIDFEING